MRLSIGKATVFISVMLLAFGVGSAAFGLNGVEAPTRPAVVEPVELSKKPDLVDFTGETSTPPTTVPDLTGVDWTALARQMYGKCGEWRELALAVGWPAEEWPTLSYVLHRESRCNIDSWNKTDPQSGSRGLMQINGFWCRPNRYDPNGFLQSVGVLKTCEDLFNPEINLRAGLAIWTYGEEKHGCGWRGPWATSCDKFG